MSVATTFTFSFTYTDFVASNVKDARNYADSAADAYAGSVVDGNYEVLYAKAFPEYFLSATRFLREGPETVNPLDLFTTCAACNNDFLVTIFNSSILCGNCLSHEQGYEDSLATEEPYVRFSYDAQY